MQQLRTSLRHVNALGAEGASALCWDAGDGGGDCCVFSSFKKKKQKQQTESKGARKHSFRQQCQMHSDLLMPLNVCFRSLLPVLDQGEACGGGCVGERACTCIYKG